MHDSGLLSGGARTTRPAGLSISPEVSSASIVVPLAFLASRYIVLHHVV
jgi:hypothetical protein